MAKVVDRQKAELYMDTMHYLYRKYGIEHIAMCVCGAVTLAGHGVDYSVALENAPGFFPDISKEFWFCFQEFCDRPFSSCNHCVNHWGLDLCACGSGDAPEKCGWEEAGICGYPSQVLKEKE